MMGCLVAKFAVLGGGLSAKIVHLGGFGASFDYLGGVAARFSYLGGFKAIFGYFGGFVARFSPICSTNKVEVAQWSAESLRWLHNEVGVTRYNHLKATSDWVLEEVQIEELL